VKYLLLGGAGFIGQHLARSLLDDGHEVTIIDNLSTSSLDLNSFTEYGNSFDFSEIDIRWIANFELLRILEQHDIVYHLAGSVGVEYIDKNPSDAIFNNIELSSKLIPLFEQANKHVVFASTSEVYGDKPEGSFSETDNASIGPSTTLRWGYAASKLMTEFMLTASSFPHTVVRFFNVVGPGQLGDYGMVLPKFIQAALNNEPLTVFGDGSQVRCFCHVDDAIRIFKQMPSYDGEIFNIGNDTPITIKELAERVIDITASKSKIVYIPYEEVFSKHHGDIMRRVPNTDKLKSVGYSPQHDLDDIIRDMI
jgi:UDP-glucose 4-epimerase